MLCVQKKSIQGILLHLNDNRRHNGTHENPHLVYAVLFCFFLGAAGLVMAFSYCYGRSVQLSEVRGQRLRLRCASPGPISGQRLNVSETEGAFVVLRCLLFQRWLRWILAALQTVFSFIIVAASCLRKDNKKISICVSLRVDGLHPVDLQALFCCDWTLTLLKNRTALVPLVVLFINVNQNLRLSSAEQDLLQPS